jgi:hypothetical protein
MKKQRCRTTPTPGSAERRATCAALFLLARSNDRVCEVHDANRRGNGIYGKRWHLWENMASMGCRTIDAVRGDGIYGATWHLWVVHHGCHLFEVMASMEE